MEWIKQLKDQFLKLWGGFDTQTRILLGTVFFALIIGLIFLANWAGKPQYEVLYSGLTDKEASEIVNWLKESNISYELEAGGSRILVPQDKKHQVRIDLAGADLSPTGGSVGYELFDQSKLGMTEKEQKMRYVRAVSGEMERSIELIDGVELAVVKISLPDSSLFIEDEKPATASVVLKLYPGVRMNQKNIIAITHLLAGGVEGVTPENVTVLDTAGNMYTKPYDAEDSFISLTSNQAQAQKEMENKIQSLLETSLGKLFGHGNVVVTVVAEMNFDRREISDKTYSPVIGDEGIIRSSQEYEESYEGSGDTPIGVPGTTSNVPEYQAATDNNSSKYQKTDNRINYDLNERLEQQIIARSEIKKLNVSVVVNRELEQAEHDKVFSLVAAAIGYESLRGDQLTVLGMEFDKSLENEYQEMLQYRNAERTRTLIIYGVAGLIGLILLWLVFRRTRNAPIAQTKGSNINTIIGDAMEEMAPTITHELTPEEKARKQMRQELSDLVSKRPEDVAQLLKTWLMDD